MEMGYWKKSLFFFIFIMLKFGYVCSSYIFLVFKCVCVCIYSKPIYLFGSVFCEYEKVHTYVCMIAYIEICGIHKTNSKYDLNRNFSRKHRNLYLSGR